MNRAMGGNGGRGEVQWDDWEKRGNLIGKEKIGEKQVGLVLNESCVQKVS